MALYDSIAAGVKNANCQAIVYLKKGVWRTSVADTEMIWYLANANRGKIEIEYKNNSIKRGLIELSSPIKVKITNTSGVCSVISFKHLEYGAGGFFGGNSDLKVVGGASCNDADGVVEAEKHLAFANNPADFFRGRIFTALAPSAIEVPHVTHASIESCVDTKCNTAHPDVGPLTLVQFYGTSDADGNPLKPFALDFKDNTVLSIGTNNYLKLRDGSHIYVDQLRYDLVKDQGSATLSELKAALRGGTLTAGQTVLNFPDGSDLSFQNLALEGGKSSVKISGGSFSGHLASGSIISINSDLNHKSDVVLNGADVNLSGLSGVFRGSEQSISAQYGYFDSQVTSADIWLNPTNEIVLGYTGFKLTLGCKSAGDQDCLPVSWDNQGTTLSGQITAFTSEITGGQLGLNRFNPLTLGSGRVKAAELLIDTRKHNSPVWGKFTEVLLSASVQDLEFDAGNKIRFAHISVSSNDLTFATDDPYPVGHLLFDGQVSGASMGGIGDIVISNAKLNGTLSRAPKDELRVDTAEIDGAVIVSYDQNRKGNVAFSLKDARYYRGQGDGKLALNASGFKYDLTTPSGSEHPECCGDLGIKSDVDIKSLIVKFSADPLSIDAEVKAAAGVWSVIPTHAISLRVAVHIDDQLGVDAKVRSKVGSTLICEPELWSSSHDYVLTASGSFSLKSFGGNLTIYNASINEGLVTHIEHKCDDVAKVLCGAIGAIVSGNPIGGAAAGIMCGQQVSKFEQQAIDAVRDGSVAEVSKFYYTSSF